MGCLRILRMTRSQPKLATLGLTGTMIAVMPDRGRAGCRQTTSTISIRNTKNGRSRWPRTIATSNGYSAHYDYREFRGRLSPEDQSKFDKEYEHWLNDRRKSDRDGAAKHEGKMQEIMARYNIPRDVPYDDIASGGRGY